MECHHQALSALIAKRPELAGKVEHHQAVTRQLMIDLDAIDSALLLFKPDIELEDIKLRPMPPRHAAYKGEVARIVLATLRNAKRACSTQEFDPACYGRARGEHGRQAVG